MSGWQWFWTVVGFILFIVLLIFLYYSAPFEQLFVRVINGISFGNVIFWVRSSSASSASAPTTGTPTVCT